MECVGRWCGATYVLVAFRAAEFENFCIVADECDTLGGIARLRAEITGLDSHRGGGLECSVVVVGGDEEYLCSWSETKKNSVGVQRITRTFCDAKIFKGRQVQIYM